MSEYTPNEQEIIEGSFASEAEARRGIARIKADALREWADAQDSIIEKFPDWSNEAGRAESYRWTKAVRTHAERIEGEA